MTRSLQAHLPTWAKPLTRPARYKALHGGRGSAKSWTVAAILLLQAMENPLRVLCAREVQKSIEESSKQVLEDAIARLGFSEFWDVRRERIYGANGSVFRFRGMNSVTNRNVRSLEGVDRVWFEEAQYMSRESAEILYPTIRAAGSELWFTFNPRYRTDPVWRDFCAGSSRLEDAAAIKVNYYDNPWFPDELERERQICLRDEPDRYPHIWLGEPDDEGSARKVLPYAMLERCVDAHSKLDISGRVDVGLDVADSGANKNALVARRGPRVFHAESWSSQVLGDTARRADRYCREYGARQLYYDVGGVGAGIRSHLAEMSGREYGATPVNFGEAVAGPTQDVHLPRQQQGLSSHGAASQLAWALRLTRSADSSAPRRRGRGP